MTSNGKRGGNGFDWHAVRKAFEAGEPWSMLEKMGPSKSTIALHASQGGWDTSKRTSKGGRQPKSDRLTKVSDNRTGKTIGQVEKVSDEPPPKTAHARKTQVDPEVVDEHFQQEEILHETITSIDNHAAAADRITSLIGKLTRAIEKDILDKRGELRGDIGMSEAKQAGGALGKLADALYKGNAIYRKNRGLHDKQQFEHSGKIDGDRSEDTLASYLGFALQGAHGGASAVSTEVSSGSQRDEELGSLEADRENISDSN